MDRTHLIKKYQPDKVVLLGLFAAGLLIAYLISNSKYTSPRKAGAQVIAEMKKRGISSLLEKQGWQSFFLIRDETNKPVGFTIDVSENLTSETGLNIHSAGFSYVNRHDRQRAMFFQSDESFDEFSWESETADATERRGTKIVRAADGMVTVTKSQQPARDYSFRPSAEAVPNYLLDLVLGQMLESSHEKIIVDTIDTSGRVIEVAISREEVYTPRQSPRKLEYRLDVHFLDELRSSQQVYFDNQQRMSLILMQYDGIYFLERSSAENISKLFPDRSRDFLQRGKILEQDHR